MAPTLRPVPASSTIELWAGWLASAMAMLLQYLSETRTATSLGQDVPCQAQIRHPVLARGRGGGGGYGLGRILGTVLGLNLLFGIPLLYSSIFGALDVILLLRDDGHILVLLSSTSRCSSASLLSEYSTTDFCGLSDPTQIAYHSVVPFVSRNALVAVGMVGSVDAMRCSSTLGFRRTRWISWEQVSSLAPVQKMLSSAITDSMKPMVNHHPLDLEVSKTRRVHLIEVVCLIIAAVVNARILLVAIPLYPNASITQSCLSQGF